MASSSSDAVQSPPHSVANDRLMPDFGRWVAVAVAALLWIAAPVFVARRLAGALSTPLDLPTLALVALATAGTAAMVRLLLPRPWFVTSAGTTAAIVLLALAMSLPGSAPLGLILLWSAVCLEVLWTLRSRTAKKPSVPPPRADESPLPSKDASAVLTDPESPHTTDPDELASGEDPDDELPAEVLQQMTRSRSPDGGEAFSGWLRVPVAVGQRTANVHLAFCPAFAQVPRVSIRQQDGPPARIRPVQVLPYGARFDLKLAQQCDEDTTLVLHFLAEAPPREVPAE